MAGNGLARKMGTMSTVASDEAPQRHEPASRPSSVRGTAPAGNDTPVDCIPVGCFVLDRDGSILRVNAVGTRMLGQPAGALEGRPLADFIAAAHRPAFSQLMQQCVAGAAVQTCEVPWADPVDVTLWVRLDAQMRPDGQTRCVVATDITMRKQAETEAAAAAVSYRRLFESAVVAISEASPDGHMLRVNAAYARMFGYDSPEQVLAEVHDIGRQLYARAGERQEILAELKAGGLAGPRVVEVVRRDGTHFHVLVTASEVRDGNGALACYQATHIDVTEQRKAETLLAEREERYRVLFESTSDALFMVERNTGRILDANQAACRLYGYTHDELLAMRNDELSDEPEESIRATRVFQAHIPLRRHRRKDGTIIHVEITTNWLTLQGQDLVLGAVRDISGRLQAEQAQRESEERFHRLFDMESDAIVLAEVDSDRILDANPAALAMYGYGRDEMLALQTTNLSAEPEATRQWVQKGTTGTAERVHRRKDGSAFPVEVSITHYTDAQGHHLFAEAIRDVTARKNADAQLRESEAKYRLLYSSMRDAYASVDMDGRLQDFNAAFAAMVGYSATELQGMSYELLTPPSWREMDGRVLREQVRVRGYSDVYERECRRKDGSVFPVELRAFLVRNADEQPIGMWAIVRDITERRRTVARIQQMQNLLNQVQSIAHMGGWEYDVATGNVMWTDEVYRILGVDEGFDRCNTDRVRALFVPESGERLRVAFASAVHEGESYDLELELRPANGRAHWVRAMGRPTRVEGRTTRVIGNFMDISDRKRAEAALQESEARFRSLVEFAPETVFVQAGGKFVYVNPAGLALFGATRPDELLGTALLDRIAPEFHAAVTDRIRFQAESKGPSPLMDQEYLRLDGTRVPVETTAVEVHFLGQQAHMVFARDITARRRAEAENARLREQFVHAQKMESVGRLAGGVAHDFNNLLMGIAGNAELCKDGLPADSALHTYLDEILDGAKRSAGITRQLLAFARKQAVAPIVFDLNDAVSSMLKLLRRLLGEDIELVWIPGPDRSTVKMDPSQLDQILANLTVNARDAIRGVGRLTIETRMVTVDADTAKVNDGAVAGRYVVLAVGDTGCGMDRETLEHIFEPFFTTKAPGEGTGLGLATVYGIVKQNEGFVTVESQPGRGTTFRIHLPLESSLTAEERQSKSDTPRPGGTETILLVEDEKAIRETMRVFLDTLGYKVLAADSPKVALAIAEAHQGPIDLLITDVVMPEMNGRELADHLVRMRPGLPALFMSGYTRDIVATRGALDQRVTCLTKPFSRDELARKVRQVLQEHRVAAS